MIILKILRFSCATKKCFFNLKTESKPYTPFSSSYSPQIPELLANLNCSIAITTYQAGKFACISPEMNNEGLVILPRTFKKPMGVALDDNSKMAIATKDEVIILENSRELAQSYPNKPNTYDNLWIPRITYHTGKVDIHDIAFSKNEIIAVNTSFSCLCKINGNFNFTPFWTPYFIDKLASEDRCHLNGLVMLDDKPKYVTALGATNSSQGWRDNIVVGGIILDVDSNEIMLKGLAMPHSPMMYKDELYLLLSATAEFIKVNTDSWEIEVLKKFDGFCRGLDLYKDYAFIGFSKLRKNSSTFSKLDFSKKANYSGIKIIHIPTNSEVGEITFRTSIDEIYEVKILPDSLRPNILNTEKEIHKHSLAIPNNTFWANTKKNKI